MPLKLRRFDFDHNPQHMLNPFEQEANFLETLNLILPIPAPFQERINLEITTEKFKKNHLLVRPGEVSRRLYFICSGFVRAFFIDENGRECTTWFRGKGDIMISVHSFFSQKPSSEYLEVLQDCKLQSLSWNQINAYYAEFKEGNALARIMMQKYYMASEERAVLLRTQAPELRYQIMLKNDPTIEQQTSLTNIASYLAITRETLSRLRSKSLKLCSKSQK